MTNPHRSPSPRPAVASSVSGSASPRSRVASARPAARCASGTFPTSRTPQRWSPRRPIASRKRSATCRSRNFLTFNAGPAAVESLLSEALDIAYIGPNPTLNAYVKSKGQAVRVIAGATSGGAASIVAQHINTAEQLRGTAVASPQLGSTPVALRAWLAKNGLKTDAYGSGDVSILPQENAQTLEAFREGKLSGAWVPEPWATRLLQEGNGKLLVDERSLWPGGRFVTTHLVVRTELLKSRTKDIAAIVRAHVEAARWIIDNPADAQAIWIDRIEMITGKRLAGRSSRRPGRNLRVHHRPTRGLAAHLRPIGGRRGPARSRRRLARRALEFLELPIKPSARWAYYHGRTARRHRASHPSRARARQGRGGAGGSPACPSTSSAMARAPERSAGSTWSCASASSCASWCFGLRQVDLAQHHRGPRHGLGRRGRPRREPARIAVSRSGAVSLARRARQRRLADAARRRAPGPRHASESTSCSRSCTCPGSPSTARTSSRAA